MERFLKIIILSFVLAVLLSACSGGGSSNSQNQQQLSGTVKVVGGSNQN